MLRLRPVLFAALLASACSTGSQSPATLLPTAQVRIYTSVPPTPAPSPTPTPTVEGWLYPHTLSGLREREYAAGQVRIGEVLAETDTFTRYAISYRSDGLTITGVMQSPRAGRPPYPVILMNHGFFSRAVYNSGDGTDRAAEFLNRHGYLTISTDYRSWGGSDLGPSLFYSGLVIDVLNLKAGLGTIPQADASRIGLWGHSMGAGVTMKILAVDNSFRAAVLYSMVSADDADIIARWGPGCVGDVVAGERTYGCNSSDILPLDLAPGLIQAYECAAADAGWLDRVSALGAVDRIRTPVQIHYGTEDGIAFSGTPPEWSQKAYLALLESGTPVEVFAYEGEKHSFIGDQWWAFMERAAHFYDEHVKPIQ